MSKSTLTVEEAQAHLHATKATYKELGLDFLDLCQAFADAFEFEDESDERDKFLSNCGIDFISLDDLQPYKDRWDLLPE